uniref:Uncharacterized protein n=1 Tax=Rhizophora mucronata TaxID=61149 RepID=A0A2P2P675_RHIMU
MPSFLLAKFPRLKSLSFCLSFRFLNSLFYHNIVLD